jgi:hypothetical protein
LAAGALAEGTDHRERLAVGANRLFDQAQWGRVDAALADEVLALCVDLNDTQCAVSLRALLAAAGEAGRQHLVEVALAADDAGQHPAAAYAWAAAGIDAWQAGQHQEALGLWARLPDIPLPTLADPSVAPPPGAKGPLAELARALHQGNQEAVAAWLAEDGVRPLGIRLGIRLLEGGKGGLLVGPDGAWMEVCGTRVDLRRRGPVRRVLVCLSEQHPQTVSGAALIEVGWPGEQMQAASARMRLHTAIRTLRRVGLHGGLQTVEGGYRLDPAWWVRQAE